MSRSNTPGRIESVGLNRLSSQYIVLGLVLIGFVIRVVNLEGHSIWIDELITRRRALISWPEMMDDLAFDQLPLYYGLLHIWVAVAGQSFFAMRFFSVIFGTLVVAVMYVTGARLYGKSTGMLIALVAALSPFLVFYSRMARAYSLLWFLVLLALYVGLRLMVRPQIPLWIAYGLLSVAAMYTHFTASVVISVISMFLLLVLWRDHNAIRAWVATHVSVFLLILPILWKVPGLVDLESRPGTGIGLTPWQIARG